MKKLLIAAVLTLACNTTYAASAGTIGITTGAGDTLCAEQQSGCKDEIVRSGPSQTTTKTTGQRIITVTNTTYPIFASSTTCWAVTIKAAQTNASSIVVGYVTPISATAGYELYPGDSQVFAAPNDSNCAGLYVNGVANDYVSVVTQ